MNRIYRIVWNEAQGAWVAVNEIATGRGPRALLSARSLRRAGAVAALAAWAGGVLAAPPAVPAAPAAGALPVGGQVVAGQAGISQAGAVLTVQQGSQRTAIDWQRFDIGRDATVRFQQPGRDSVTLNRVLGNQPSQIFGRIQADGQVFLSNPSGVYFAPGASADVGGLVATTMAIGVDEFMAGGTTLSRSGGSAGVLNEGTLQARYGGYIALLAPEVVNSGVVAARAGTVALAAGERVELQFAGGRLARLRVEPAAVAALIDNRQAVMAPDGTLLMSARAAQSLGGGVIRHSGSMAADSLRAQGGRIVLEADRIDLAEGSRTSATGATGGGDIRIGGGWQGSGDTYQAREVRLAPGASVDASATGRGDGGSVVLWTDVHQADSRTEVQGRLTARGGAQGGDGGRIETSGHALAISGSTVDASAASARGAAGLWLIDPYDMTISSSPAVNNVGWASTGPGSNMWVNDLINTLNAGNSIVVATGTAGGDRGDITVNAPITKSTGGTVTLTLRAANSIIVNQPIGVAGSARMNVVFDADNDNGLRDGAGMTLLNANVSTGGGSLSFGTGAMLNLNGVATRVGGDVYLGAGAGTLSTGGGAFTVNGEMLIGNPAGVVVNTAGGAATFRGAIDSANSYAYVATGPVSWINALAAAQGATGGGAAVGDTYLATLTSRSENMIASQVANYAESWLGARRGATTPNAASPASTDDTWRWVAGPEGQAEAGQGQRFFQGRNSAGSTAPGRYANWSPGEPNDYAPGESALQFVGNRGQWNDMPADLASVTGYLRETNLAASALTVQAGTGAVSFLGAVGGQRALSTLDVTGGSITVAGGGVRTQGAQSYNGPILLGSGATVLERTDAGTDFTLGSNQSISYSGSAPASLTVLATRHINLGSDVHIESTQGPLDVVLNADSDRANADGRGAALAGGGVFADPRLTVRTAGGSLRIGGGDARDGSGMAIGLAGMGLNTRGIFLRAVDIDTGSGHIEMRGTGSTADGEGILIQAAGGQSRLSASGGGHITMEGVGGAAGTPAAWTTGLALEQAALQTAQGDITLTGIGGGYGSSTPVNQSGVRFAVAGTNSVVSASGSIGITGTLGSPSGFGTGGSGIEFAVATAVGNGNGARSTVTGSVADIGLNTDRLSVAGGTTLSSAGTLSVAPLTASASIGLASAAGTLQLPASFFTSTAADGFSQIRIGRSDGSGALQAGSLAVRDALLLQTGSGPMLLAGVVNAGGETVTLRSEGSVVQQPGAGLVASGLRLQGGGAFDLQGSQNAIGTVAGDVGSLNLTQATALTIGSVDNVHGLQADGAVTVATASGDLHLAAGVASNATGDDAITLAAGRATGAGDAGGGNITVADGATVTAGPGGRATLYSGAVAGSTGLAALAGEGSGRFRYGSAEGSSGYTRALDSGVNVVFRERPTVTLQVADARSVYGQAMAPGFTGSGYANGDTDAGALTGSAGYSVEGPRSGAGLAAVGTHAVSLAGLASDLGYAVQTRAGQWTVTPAQLSVGGLAAADKVYDGSTAATLNLADARWQGRVAGDELTLAAEAGRFADKNAGRGKTVAITGLALGGADAANYVLATTEATASASITPATIAAVTGIVALDKVYDATPLAGLDSSAARFEGQMRGDTLSLATATGRFVDKNAGNGKAVRITDLSLGGADAGNYVLASTEATASARIAPAVLALAGNLVAQSRVEDGSTAAQADLAGLSLAGVAAGDSVALTGGPARFDAAQPGNGRTVTVAGLGLTGADAANYRLATDRVTTTADIYAAPPLTTPALPPVVLPVLPVSTPAGLPPLVSAVVAAPAPAPAPAAAPAPEPAQPAPRAEPEADAGTTLSTVPIRIAAGEVPMTALPAAAGSPAIAVQLVQAPGAAAGGLVSVTVPEAVLRSAGGFSFPLPDALLQPVMQGAAVSVTTADGQPLPGWLSFDAATGRFVGQAVPQGGLPLQVQLTIGGQRTRVSIDLQPR